MSNDDNPPTEDLQNSDRLFSLDNPATDDAHDASTGHSNKDQAGTAAAARPRYVATFDKPAEVPPQRHVDTFDRAATRPSVEAADKAEALSAGKDGEERATPVEDDAPDAGESVDSVEDNPDEVRNEQTHLTSAEDDSEAEDDTGASAAADTESEDDAHDAEIETSASDDGSEPASDAGLADNEDKVAASAEADSQPRSTSSEEGHANNDDPNDEATEPAAEQGNGFADLGLKPAVLTALIKLGYEEPTPIQRQAIPQLIEGADLIGQAATGTGKTAAFALPILNNISKGDAKIPLALIVVPTRELAVQVSEAFFKYGRESNVQVLPVFGGQPISRQLQALRRGVHVVVGTPGRLIDHINRGSLDLDAVQTVVLDEADEMLDMGFTEDIESILQATPKQRQTVLFSATMPPRIAKIAKTYQRDPVTVQIGKSKDDEANPLIRQSVYMVLRAHKASALGRILDIEAPDSAIVFCRTRHEVDELTVTMNARGYRAEALHGGMDQKQRDRVMARLRDGTAELLVATDVAARGLDVDTLTHVVNYDVPSAPESYVHRIGRVGRAGREGVAITIAEPRQRRLLGNIERLTKQKFDIAKVPTVADLRTRQIEITVDAVKDALVVQDLEDYAAVLNTLSEEYSERDIALAAIKLVHRARGATMDEREIPDASEWKKGKGKADNAGRGKFDKGGKGGGKKFDKGRKGKSYDGAKGYVHISIGRKVGLRPGDLVGAIANEAGLNGSDIGPIKINDHFAVVGIPDSEVDNVVKAMKKTTIRGKQAKLRRFTD